MGCRVSHARDQRNAKHDSSATAVSLPAIVGELAIAAACTFIPPLPSLLGADGLRRYLIRRGSRSAVSAARL
jgi:hypothetical protein